MNAVKYSPIECGTQSKEYLLNQGNQVTNWDMNSGNDSQGGE